MKAAKITAKIRDAVPVCIYAEGNEQARYKNIELPDEIKALEIQDFGFDIDAAGWISFRLYFEPGILPAELPEPRPQLTREQKRAAKAAETLLASLKAAKAAEAAGLRQTSGPDAWSEPATEENAPEHPGEPSDNIADYLPAAEAAAPAPGEDYTIETPEGTIIAEIRHGELTDAPAEDEDAAAWQDTCDREDRDEDGNWDGDETPHYLREQTTEDAPEADEPAAIRFDVPGKKRGALARAIADITGDAAEYLNPPSYAYRIGTLGLERDGSLIGELPSGLLETLAEQGFTPAE